MSQREPFSATARRYLRLISETTRRYLRLTWAWLQRRGRELQRGALAFRRWLSARLADARAALGELRKWRPEREDYGEGPQEVVRAAGERGPRLAGATTIVAEREDDASSIIGRIDAASEVQLLLVVPRRAQGLRDAMEWPRIAAHVRQRGLALNVLASRRNVRQHAESAGLDAARTVRGLRPRPSLRVPLGTREFVLQVPPLVPVLRAAGLVVAVAVIAGAACVYIPSADIVVAPPAEPLTTTVRVHLNPVSETDVDLGVVAATSIQRTIVSVVSTTTTGTATVGDTSATVELTFTNDGDADVALSIGTPVDDEGGFTFTTDDAVTVPAGESAVVAATSLRPGTAGNLEADSLRLLIGFPPTLSVTNLEVATGGSDTDVPAVGAEDVERVGEIAEQVLCLAGERELLRTVEDGTVFLETVSLEIVSQEPLARVGQPANVFLMEYTAVIFALYLPDVEAAAAGEQLLVRALPDGMALLPGTTETVVGGNVVYDGSRLLVDLTATGLATPLIDPAALRGELTGVSPDTAAVRLRELLGLEQDPLITVHPSWLPDWRMPQRASNISIELVNPEALAIAIAGEPEDDDAADEGEDGETGDTAAEAGAE